MLYVNGDRDLVIVIAGRGLRDLILTPKNAETFAEELERCAQHCENWLKSGGSKHVFVDERYEIEDIKSWDGNVNIRFSRFIGPRIPMPIDVAREVAKRVKMKIEEAKYFLSVNHNPVATTGS